MAKRVTLDHLSYTLMSMMGNDRSAHNTAGDVSVEPTEIAWMRRALRLARRGRGRVSPDPLVGAVLARDGRVIGEGAHLQLGGPHAEANALEKAGSLARGATMYVTLEPCSHHGRTPPCSRAVIEAGIVRVVCAMEDPDSRVRGRGIEELRAAGVVVDVGLLRADAETLNRAYLKHRRENMPLVILKLGQTLDGQIGTRTGDSKWITGIESRTHAHRWRSWVDAIMVGAGTVVADDPQLNVRHVRGRNPRPVVVDGRLRISPQARLFSAPDAVLATAAAPAEQRAFKNRGVEVWSFADREGHIDLRELLARLAADGVNSLLIEGGAELAANALKEQVVDQVMIYVAPRLLGRGIAGIGDLGIVEVDQAIRLENLKTRKLGTDVLFTAEVNYSCSPD